MSREHTPHTLCGERSLLLLEKNLLGPGSCVTQGTGEAGTISYALFGPVDPR